MRVKVGELTVDALDWLVAHIEEDVPVAEFLALKKLPESDDFWKYRHSTNWAQGGPIIDREEITWSMNMVEPEHGSETRYCAFSYRGGSSKAQSGPTKLIAAMRCYVASKLGDEVEVPEKLL